MRDEHGLSLKAAQADEKLSVDVLLNVLDGPLVTEVFDVLYYEHPQYNAQIYRRLTLTGTHRVEKYFSHLIPGH